MMNNILKTAVLTVAILGMQFSASAQTSKYVNSAWNLLNDGTTGSLIEAKDDIDKAMKYEGATENAKMWLVRSMVYSRIFMKKGDSLIMPLSKSAGFISGEAMMKFWQNSTRKKIDVEDAIAETPSTFIACYNESFATFQEKDYAKTIEYYRLSLFLFDKLDTATANSMERQDVSKKGISDKMAIAAYSCTDKKLGTEVLQQMADAGSTSLVVLEGLSKSYLESKDTARAEQVIRDGIKRAPGNNAIFQLLINYYVSIDKVDRLFEDLNKQLEVSPDSKLYYSRGVLYEQRKQNDKAVEDYTKAIELDEFNYDANNNLGRLLLLFRRDILMDKKMRSSGEARKQADLDLKDLYKLATKYLEMAAENNDYGADELISIHRTLKNVALELGDQAKADVHEATIKALQLTKTNSN